MGPRLGFQSHRALAWWLDRLTWHVWLFAFLGANANQLHKYAHMSADQTPAPVRILQKSHILQGVKDHSLHYIGAKNMAYCVITPYLNPVLDGIGFWRFLERLTVPIFGAPRREDLR